MDSYGQLLKKKKEEFCSSKFVSYYKLKKVVPFLNIIQ